MICNKPNAPTSYICLGFFYGSGGMGLVYMSCENGMLPKSTSLSHTSLRLFITAEPNAIILSLLLTVPPAPIPQSPLTSYSLRRKGFRIISTAASALISPEPSLSRGLFHILCPIIFVRAH